MKIKPIETKARKLMITDSNIWNKYGWKSGGQVDIEIYKKELGKKVKGKLPMLYYYIFEDANYHTLNQALEEMNKFKGKYGSDESERQYNEYKQAGGKTWKL